jgi:predicted 3-demethylubiquinone-9 3-methyltransferase (glyoxalase superfamily)
LSRQIVPSTLQALLRDKDPEKAARVMNAMLKMSKIGVKTLQDA